MTERLYYRDSFLHEFEAQVLDSLTVENRPVLILDRTAFYPTSGGQLFDTGWLTSGETKVRVAEVVERDDGAILHFLDEAVSVEKGSRIQGAIDTERRRDHMQQHSGQHVLSAAFVRLFNMPTVSFHMGADYCSIDLETRNLTAQQVESAEALANQVITEDRPVDIRFVTSEEAQKLGLRKLPPSEREKLRLIDIREFDLTACGGTHVRNTGQIGCILLRKTEKVRQGWRVEFVCGKRAVETARRDYMTLTEAASLFSSHVWDIPQQVRKSQEEARTSQKSQQLLLEEVADFQAKQLLAEAEEHNGRRIVVRIFQDRDLNYVKLLAQRLTQQDVTIVALLATTLGSPTLVFAQSAGQPSDMGALMKIVLAKLGGRGGGSKDMAQGGAAQIKDLQQTLADAAASLDG